MAQAVHYELQEWHVEDSVRAMCFDTKTSNTGPLPGACIIFEQLLAKHLLHFACLHHIFEIILGFEFQKCLSLAGAC